MSSVRLGYASPDGMPATPLELRTQLARLLRLAEHGIEVLAVRMFGNGPSAGLELDLSGDLMIECEHFGDLWTATGLGKWITQSIGIDAGKITKPDATAANAIIRQLATVVPGRRVSDIGRDHGLGFLRHAPVETVRLNEQADRWRAFVRLDALNPTTPQADRFSTEPLRPEAPTIARGSLVLLDAVNGWRLIHTGHFFSFVRASGEVNHPAELARRMTLTGWARSGKRGDVKATSPRTGATIRLRLWRIPPDWEERGDDDA